MKKITLFVMAAIFASIPSADAFAAMHRFTGSIIGLSGRHKVYVSLWNAEKWGGAFPLSTSIIHPEKVKDGVAEYSTILPDGEYAISVFEDANGNGRLDYDESILGQAPAEPYAFFRSHASWLGFSWPGFRQVSFKTNRPDIFAKIRMRNRIR